MTHFNYRLSLTHSNGHALVLGGSMAGLITARILANHFQTVTILERDPVRPEPESRKGQSHTRHLHALLTNGLEILREYFPGIVDDLKAAGGILNHPTETMNWYTHGGYRTPFESDFISVLMSRPALEAVIREQVLAHDNIRLIDQCAVKGLRHDSNRNLVTGVDVEFRNQNEGNRTFVANLIVDCTGRGSRSSQWLKALGYKAPATTEVTVNVGYSTREFKRDLSDPRSGQWHFVTPDGKTENRFAGMFPIEGDRWILSMGGRNGDECPADPDGFLNFAKGLPANDIYDIIRTAEPVSDVLSRKYKSSLRRHYERMSHFPSGYLVLGDAIASFNPTYGQGMTSAIMQAKVLDNLLVEGVSARHLARRFFKQAAAVVDIPWRLAVGEDFRYSSTEGKKPIGTDFVNWYVGHVNQASHVDAEVCNAFLAVMNLMAPPASLFAPKIMWRVFQAQRNRQASGANTAQHQEPALVLEN